MKYKTNIGVGWYQTSKLTTITTSKNVTPIVYVFVSTCDLI